MTCEILHFFQNDTIIVSLNATWYKTSTIDIEFDDLLRKLRSKSDSIPSLNEITEEVEIIRTARYAE